MQNHAGIHAVDSWKRWFETREIELDAHFRFEKVGHRVGLIRSRGPLDTGIEVFGVFPEHHHIDLFRVFHGAGHRFDIADRTNAGIQVQPLPDSHVQAADPLADGRGQRPLDRHHVGFDGVQCILGQVIAGFGISLLPHGQFHP